MPDLAPPRVIRLSLDINVFAADRLARDQGRTGTACSALVEAVSAGHLCCRSGAACNVRSGHRELGRCAAAEVRVLPQRCSRKGLDPTGLCRGRANRFCSAACPGWWARAV